MNSDVAHAREIAEAALAGRVKKGGEPLLEHVARVAASVADEIEQIIAWLHDVPENAPEWTLERLQQEGFAPAVLAAVDALTRREGESHADLVRRTATNPLARKVKLADLRDNLATAERTGGDGEKYRNGLRLLEA
nr:HD domain-containing protein [Rhizobium sp. TCK]